MKYDYNHIRKGSRVTGRTKLLGRINLSIRKAERALKVQALLLMMMMTTTMMMMMTPNVHIT
jgi:hypothetical protein